MIPHNTQTIVNPLNGLVLCLAFNDVEDGTPFKPRNYRDYEVLKRSVMKSN